MIHHTADVQSRKIGEGTRIWQYVSVLPSAIVGADCNICSHCFIENDVVIGDRTTIKSGVYLWDGLRLGSDVFVGPGATFSNDKFPRSKHHLPAAEVTIVEDGASIGANATILPGIRIGRCAMIGAGSVVTRSVPPNAIVVGNPARIVGYTGTQVVSVEGPAEESKSSSGVGGVRIVNLPHIVDIRGSLSVGEFGRSVPFDPKRYFLVFDVPSAETRGEHAHKTCHQFLICVKGSVTVLADDGRRREQYILDRPNVGFYMPPRVWGTQYKYSREAVLLVFASHFYDADDYIREYDEFLRLSGVSQ